MDFFSCPCLLSELTDWIKGIGFPQTPRVIDISADQMQNTADLQHGSKDCYIILVFVFVFPFEVVRIVYTAKENRKNVFGIEAMLVIVFVFVYSKRKQENCCWFIVAFCSCV